MATGVDAGWAMGQSRNMVEVSAAASGHDPALVKAAQDGNRDAFGLLYERYGAMVHGVLLARVPYDEVEDLVQEVFVVALERLPTLRTPAAFGGWLGAIARHRAVDYHRRTSKLADARDSPVVDEGPRAEALAVLSAIRTLPEAYRETLTLRFVEGMTGPEIAARTGLTPGSVRVNLHRGTRLLRQKLDGTRTP